MVAMVFMQVICFSTSFSFFAQIASFAMTVTAERNAVLLEERQDVKTEYNDSSVPQKPSGRSPFLASIILGGSDPVCSDHQMLAKGSTGGGAVSLGLFHW